MELSAKQVGTLWKRPKGGYNISLYNSKYLALPPLKNEEKAEFIVWKRNDNARPNGAFLENYSKVGYIIKPKYNLLMLKINNGIYEVLENREKTSNYLPEFFLAISSFNEEGYDKEGYNRYGFDRRGIHKDTLTLYNLKGYDKNGYDKDGYDRDGFDLGGIHRDTGTNYNRQGYDKEGNMPEYIKIQKIKELRESE